MIQQYAVITCI